MFKNKGFLWKAAVLMAVTSTAWCAQQKGWLDKILPSKTPQVLQPDSNSKKGLVEPHPDVLALQDSFANVAQAVKPAVVNIAAVQITQVQEDPHEFFFGDPNDFFYRYFGQDPSRQSPQRRAPREYRSQGTGSGVIIDPDGYILTNNHVVQGADQLTVTMSDDKSYKGNVIGTDPRTDLAVIKIKGLKAFPYLPLADSSQTRIGDWVIAVGSPFGLEQTVTAGIISAIRQSLNIEGKVFRNLLQTDAAINRGNSGGPLVNLRGEILGINTAIYAPTGVFSGIGFAVPINEAKKILKDLIEKGYVERSWMGVEIVDVDEVMSQQFGLASTDGALINQTVPNSPAERAGLERGDVIVEFDGKKVTGSQSLQDVVSVTPPDKTVKVRVIRQGESKTFTLKTAIMPRQNSSEPSDHRSSDGDSLKKSAKTEWLGCSFADVSMPLRNKFSLADSVEGIVAVDVPVSSVGAEAGLQEGDLIRAIGKNKIRSIRDLAELQKTIDIKSGLVFDIVRDGRSFYLSYKSVE